MKISTIPFSGTHMDIPSVTHLTQLSDFDEINQVLLSQKFVQGGFREPSKSFMTGVITLLDGKLHAQRRLIMSQLLSDNRIAMMRERFLGPAIDHSLGEVATGGKRLNGAVYSDLVMLAQRSVHRVAAAVSGVDGIDDLEATDRFVRIVRRLADGVGAHFSRGPIEEALREAEAAKQELNEGFFAASLARRLALADDVQAGRSAKEDLPEDLLMQLVLHRNDVWSGDDTLPLREIAHFLVGASQSTANSLVLFLIRLEQWFDDHPEDRALIVDDPNFLRSAAFESLRLTVGAPARLRTALEDVTLKSGRVIKKGETVVLLFIPANMNKGRFGDDANEFNPRRRVGSHTPWGLSFGAGAHACPGRPLVTGNRSMKAEADIDGTLVTISRRLYAAGFRLDEKGSPVPDPATHYSVFLEVPIKFIDPGALTSSRACAQAAP